MKYVNARGFATRREPHSTIYIDGYERASFSTGIKITTDDGCNVRGMDEKAKSPQNRIFCGL
jgi:hypothetical protein